VQPGAVGVAVERGGTPGAVAVHGGVTYVVEPEWADEEGVDVAVTCTPKAPETPGAATTSVVARSVATARRWGAAVLRWG